MKFTWQRELEGRTSPRWRGIPGPWIPAIWAVRVRKQRGKWLWTKAIANQGSQHCLHWPWCRAAKEPPGKEIAPPCCRHYGPSIVLRCRILCLAHPCTWLQSKTRFCSCHRIGPWGRRMRRALSKIERRGRNNTAQTMPRSHAKLGLDHRNWTSTLLCPMMQARTKKQQTTRRLYQKSRRSTTGGGIVQRLEPGTPTARSTDTLEEERMTYGQARTRVGLTHVFSRAG